MFILRPAAASVDACLPSEPLLVLHLCHQIMQRRGVVVVGAGGLLLVVRQAADSGERACVCSLLSSHALVVQGGQLKVPVGTLLIGS